MRDDHGSSPFPGPVAISRPTFDASSECTTNEGTIDAQQQPAAGHTGTSSILPAGYECDGEAVPQPAATHSEIPTAGWKVVAESVRGASHEKAGVVCQDSHCVLAGPENILIAAIADGAGSAAHSEIGAALAVRTAVDNLALRFTTGLARPSTDSEWARIMVATLEAARDAVVQEALTLGVNPRELASTLILVLATPECIIASQVGDGAVVVEAVGGELSALTVPQSGEYLNETTFLVTPGALDHAQTAVWTGRAEFLAAFSDGLQMLALRMSDGTPHRPFFAPLFRFIEAHTDMEEARRELTSFLTSSRVAQRADDDLTLLLAQWPSASPC